MNRYATLLGLLTTTSAVFAQDIHFSPVDAAPVMLNASYTGSFDGNLRISALYQNAWQTAAVPYLTYGLSADMPVFTGQDGSYFAAGLQILKDQAGDGNLANFYGVASLAYHKLLSKPLNDKSCGLAIGVQGGYAQKTIDIGSLYFGEEFANGVPTQFSHLGLGNNTTAYTLNSGISFSQSTGHKFSYTIGLAGNNLNQPNDAIDKKQNTGVGLDLNFSASFGANWLIAKRFTLRPSIYACEKASSTEVIAGTELQYNFGNGNHRPFVNNVFAGAWYRTADAITYSAGIEFARFRVGMGLDRSFSAVNTSTSTGGLLCHVRYITPQKSSTQKRRIVPCSRF